MEIFIVIISWLLFGGASSYFASQRGRDPFAWFLIGMLLGILGLLLLFLLPPVKPVDGEKNETLQELEALPSPSLAAAPPPYRLQEWFYLDEERHQVGPNTFNILRKNWEEGKLSPRTLVWSEGMESWKQIEELPYLKEALQ